MSAPDMYYQKTLLDAVSNGDALELQRLLEEKQGKLNLNVYDREGQTVLHKSCFSGNLELVKLLVQSGADTKLTNKDGWAPMHIAAYLGHYEICLYLTKTLRQAKR